MFDREKVLTPFNCDKAKKGDWGWGADSPRKLELNVDYEKPLMEIINLKKGQELPFVLADKGGYTEYRYFYPAPYEFMQKKWVEEVGLKVGDKVRIVKKWEKGEGGFDCAMGFLQEVNLVGYVDSIEKDSIYVALHSGPYHTPYFALEKVEEAPTTHRPFANAEEFKPYREGWWQFRTSGVVFKVDTYQEDGVYVPGEEKRVPFDVFLDKYTNADTGEPAGVKL